MRIHSRPGGSSSSGGGGTWGSITGTLSSQADLQAALDAKVASTRTISTTSPLSGGGDLSSNRTFTTSMATNKLIGRSTVGTGVMEEITLGTNLSFSGTTLNAAGSSPSIGGAITSGTAGSILYVNPTAIIDEDNNYFYYDDDLNTQSVGTNSLVSRLPRITSASSVLTPPTSASASIPSYTTAACAGSATACSGFDNNQAGCEQQDPCVFTGTCDTYDTQPTTCDATSGCAFDFTTCAEQVTAEACNALVGTEGSCTATTYDCSQHNNTDEGTCVAGNPSCVWNDPNCEGTPLLSCDGTYSNLCSDYSSTEANCTAHEPCVAVSDGDCHAWDMESESTCEEAPHTTCVYDNGDRPCSDYDADEASCGVTSGCTQNYADCDPLDEGSCAADAHCTSNFYNCGDSSGTDQGTCEGHAGCTWNDPTCEGTSTEFLSCSGGNHFHSCSGTYNNGITLCNGTYYNGTCTGSYVPGDCGGSAGTCTGSATACTASPVNVNQSSCELQAGCDWSLGGKTYTATGLQHRYRIYSYKAFGGIRYYSSTYSETSNVTDNNSGDGYDIDVTWTAPAAFTPDGYKILKSTNGGSSYTTYKEDTASPYVDGGGFTSGSTVTPSTFFSYYGNGPTYANPYIIIESSTTTDSLSGANAFLFLNNTSASGFTSISAQFNSVMKNGIVFGNSGNIDFRTINGIRHYGNLAGTGTPHWTVDSAGRFGIGVSTPNTSSLLDVAGVIRFGSMFLNYNNNETAQLKSNSSSAVGLQLLNSAGTNYGLFGGRTSNSFFSWSNSNPFRFERSDTNALNATGVRMGALAINSDTMYSSSLFYIAGSSGYYVLEGKMSLGIQTAPIAILYLPAGTASANTAPIGIQTGGTLMSTPQAGMIETNSDKIYYTIPTGTARKEFVLADGTLTSGRVSFSTTNGRQTDDADFTFATDTLTVTKIAATTFTGNITLSTKDIVTDTTTGTKIGTGTTQKLGFYNATPIVQGASVADASGGVVVDAEARTAVNALISRIEALGLIATV